MIVTNKAALTASKFGQLFIQAIKMCVTTIREAFSNPSLLKQTYN